VGAAIDAQLSCLLLETAAGKLAPDGVVSGATVFGSSSHFAYGYYQRKLILGTLLHIPSLFVLN
jgi:hypothetical protein